MILQPVVQESMKLIRSSLSATIDIRVQIAEETGAVIGDSTQMHQLEVNLCTNAYQAMRDSGGLLEVALTAVGFDASSHMPCRDMRSGTYVCLSVKDTGHGIDEAIIDRIFEPYFTTKGPAEGTGMGLSIVHGIVKGHKGYIDVDSTLGKGTTFRAFQRAPDAFDLLITDQTMPKMTGASLSVAVLEIRGDLPVILCTGFSEALSPEAAADIGIQHYLQNPVPLKVLARTVRLALNEVCGEAIPPCAPQRALTH